MGSRYGRTSWLQKSRTNSWVLQVVRQAGQTQTLTRLGHYRRAFLGLPLPYGRLATEYTRHLVTDLNLYAVL